MILVLDENLIRGFTKWQCCSRVT